jgi:preprotein translocase subunit SecG
LSCFISRSGDLPVPLLAATWYSHILNFIVIGIGLILMLIVLIQRGKGGGLAGAFGGAGGSSPFGSRAADQFVRITLWLAGVWVLVLMIHVKVVKYDTQADSQRSITTNTQ